jgi:hypothetical protein
VPSRCPTTRSAASRSRRSSVSRAPCLAAARRRLSVARHRPEHARCGLSADGRMLGSMVRQSPPEAHVRLLTRLGAEGWTSTWSGCQAAGWTHGALTRRPSRGDGLGAGGSVTPRMRGIVGTPRARVTLAVGSACRRRRSAAAAHSGWPWGSGSLSSRSSDEFHLNLELREAAAAGGVKDGTGRRHPPRPGRTEKSPLYLSGRDHR